VPEELVGTARRGSPLETVALDDSGETFALRCAGDVDKVSGLEDINGIDGTHLIRLEVFRCHLELPENLRRRHIGLLEMAGVGLVEALDLDHFVETDLDCVVAFLIGGFFLDHVARTGFYDRDGNDVPVFIKYLRHAELLAYKT
jgi:hypothetical protein